MIQKQPKILVLSHNCFSESSANGRTLSTFFRFWKTPNVAQFYVNSEIPNSKVCDSYYRITDIDILSSTFKSKKSGGQMNNTLPKKNVQLKKVKSSSIERFKRLKNLFPSILYMFRNFLWSVKNWNHLDFNSWVDDFKPDLILLQPGDYSFLYKMSRVISKRKNIPLVVYNSEDYFLKDRFSISPFFYVQRFNFKREVKKTYNKAQLIIYSNDLLETNLHKYFKSKSAVVLSSSEIKPSQTESNNILPRLVYAGNLAHERWKSLVTIGKVVKKINKELVIEVYSGSLPKEAENDFVLENGINFKGSVNYEKVIAIINNSDIVIHTEGFTDFIKWDIRHGFSTKIADLLSSEKCFLMYGPKEIACVDYLISNEAAWVASTKLELKNVLLKILNSEIERKKYVSNAKKLVEERHNLHKNCEMFEELMLEVYLNYQN
jgi:glycosyltransferase involved in cell wall biosynthesis